MAILFQLTPCTISVIAQISKAVMATAFEPVQSIVFTIQFATRIKSHAFSCFMETLMMHYNIDIRSLSVQAPLTSIHDFFHGPPFVLKIFENRIKI